MDVELLLKLAFIGVAAGLLSGLFGVGGGIILVPMLVWALGMTQVRAQGTSLAAIMLLPMGLMAVLQYHRHGNVDFRTAGIIALFFLAGSWAGARLANGMNLDLLRKLFALLLAAVAVKLFFFKN
ncbi:MAG: sulfite exporter TauE/SafE family protein [Flavobacteriales bacterium]|nr:sulfite exporter TauE/SafE family protein [Flavobacteriales bacterium]MCX7651217.1 sulfite exporter TauE/SafE family protein [Flavobacteriales bacterium]MDW8431984.1 sulfite exporter TauE/SafE family protein [Flavobacteriales bacterium]